MNGWVLLSYHNFKETPTSLQTLFTQMNQKNVDFLKIAVMPQNEKDVDDLLCAAKWAKQNSKACIVAIAMGELGKRSRISKDTCLTFASVDQNSAPGQIPLDEMVAIFEEKIKAIIETYKNISYNYFIQ